MYERAGEEQAEAPRLPPADAHPPGRPWGRGCGPRLCSAAYVLLWSLGGVLTRLTPGDGDVPFPLLAASLVAPCLEEPGGTGACVGAGGVRSRGTGTEEGLAAGPAALHCTPKLPKPVAFPLPLLAALSVPGASVSQRAGPGWWGSHAHRQS